MDFIQINSVKLTFLQFIFYKTILNLKDYDNKMFILFITNKKRSNRI